MENIKIGKTRTSSYANTFHLSRILLFLRENKGYFVRKEISEKCCMNKEHTSNALKFLVKEFFVNEFFDRSLHLFSLNEKQPDREKIREKNKKFYIKNKKKRISKINKEYREKQNGTR